jgi:hypothetical protein
MSVFVPGALPGFMNKSRPVDQLKRTLLASKIGIVQKRGHIKAGPIKSLADFFDVPKGDDIRMVHNGTSSGLNDALWAPSFCLLLDSCVCFQNLVPSLATSSLADMKNHLIVNQS